MKRFNLIFISLLLLLGSCSKEMREDNTTLEQSSIGFWSYVGSSTRAIDRIDTNFDNFSVIAYTLDGEGDLEYEYIPRSTVSRTPTESLDSWGDWKIANNAN